MNALHARLAVVLLALSSACAPTPSGGEVEIVRRSELELVPLNPLRGDASPKAGVLWGDLKGEGPTGALIRFVGDFSSPPHIHNVTYRAVVLEGVVHNDDPEAAPMWMEPGSFWTQPAGEAHITSAGPEGAVAFLEIDSGPYLVRPPAEAFDNGERPINIEARNVVWLAESNGLEVAYLWGDPEVRHGAFLRLAAGTGGHLSGKLRAVVIAGRIGELDAGSYLGLDGSHPLACDGDRDCVLYLSAEGRFDISPR